MTKVYQLLLKGTPISVLVPSDSPKICWFLFSEFFFPKHVYFFQSVSFQKAMYFACWLKRLLRLDVGWLHFISYHIIMSLRVLVASLSLFRSLSFSLLLVGIVLVLGPSFLFMCIFYGLVMSFIIITKIFETCASVSGT